MCKNQKNKYTNNINMIGKSKKKYKNYINKVKTKKRRRSIRRFRGGDENKVKEPNKSEESNKSEEKLKTPEEIMKEVKEERQKEQQKTDSNTNEEGLLGKTVDLTENIGAEVVDKSKDLVEGVTANAIDNTGKLVGVDLTDTEETNKKLDEIKATISDPETQEKTRELIGESAKLGAVAVEAAQPFLDPLVDTISDKSEKLLSKLGESSVKIMLNTAEEIPGVGVIIGTARSASNIGEAIAASANTGSELVTTTSDTINAATKNFKQIMDEKKNIEDRTNTSINEFENPVNVPESKVPKRGGTKKMFTKNKGTKRVRFKL